MRTWRIRLTAMLATAAIVTWADAAMPEPAPGDATSVSSPRDNIEPRAADLLKRMSDYLANLKEFSVRSTSTTEVTRSDGQKLQFEAVSDVFVRRPDRVRSNRVGALADLEFYYDGRNVTLFGKRGKYYATATAPPTLDRMFDEVRARLEIEPPGADLLYADVYGGLMPGVTEAFYVGAEEVGGFRTHHLAFRAPDVDWQIWIDAGERPLPRKYLITTKGSAGAPEFGVSLTRWNLAPKLNEATFKFKPPPGAQQIDFIPADLAPAATR